MFTDPKTTFGLISVVLSFVTCIPYFWAIYKGTAHPHFFTWFSWALFSVVIFCAQITEGAGPGAWVNGLGIILNLIMAGLALKYGEKNITRSDWVSFIGVLLCIPIWVFTGNPVYSILIICVIDVFSFYPTFRKSWMKPWDEDAPTYIISTLKYVFSILAIQDYNFSTTFYPAWIILIEVVFLTFLYTRRHIIAKNFHNIKTPL